MIELLVVVALVGSLLSWGVWHQSDVQKMRRALRRQPRRAIAAAADEDVKLSGRVVVKSTIEAPLSGRACVAYELVVEEEVAARALGWIELVREVQSVAFVLEDDSGRAVVEPDGADVALREDARTSSGRFDPANEREHALLIRLRIFDKTSFGLNRNLRFREGVLCAGDEAIVTGRGTRELDPDAGHSGSYRDAAPTRLRVAARVLTNHLDAR